jgi:hypothetical protein
MDHWNARDALTYYNNLFKIIHMNNQIKHMHCNLHRRIFHAAIACVLAVVLMITFSGCKKLVEVSAPVTNLNAANVYESNVTAAAVLTGIYTNMSLNNSSMSDIPGISLRVSLSADELTLINGVSNQDLISFYKNALSSQTGTNYWSAFYPVIYAANSALEGLSGSNTLTPAVKQQLAGEAKFIRAFSYFYLVNFYGDVPLVTTTNYQINQTLARTPKAQVYQQIVQDLIDAQNELSPQYLKADALTTYPAGSEQRVRPTKWAAKALLARVYLYMGNSHYGDAEAQASSVINNTSEFALVSLDNAFLKNNQEAIWQLQPVNNGVLSNTGEGVLFVLPSTGPANPSYPVYLSSSLYNTFESGDQRKTHWISSVTPPGSAITYYYPYKYKIGAVNTATSEYSTIFRLGELYLIRAEARAQLGNIIGAQADLNAIRSRAGLVNTSATTQANLLTAILHERQVELFTEWGHRWLDLKRTGNVDAVMGAGGACAVKGGTWNTNWQWYPLPLTDIQKDVNLVQNSGY